MLITKEEQEQLLDKYIKSNANTYTWQGFIDGMNAALKLMDKKMKLEQTKTIKHENK